MATTLGSGRHPAIDVVKAAAVVAVVFTHSHLTSARLGPSIWDFPLTSAWVRFQVPAFLLISGLLYARPSPIPLREIGRRLTRILIPYTVATLVAFALVVPPPGLGDALWKLATGSTFGIYYYVFILVVCIALSFVFSRMRRRHLVALWILLLGLVVLEISGNLHRLGVPFFWKARLPIYRFGLGYFVTGWIAALILPELVAWARARRRILAAVAAVGIVGGIGAFGLWIPVPLLPARIVYTFSVVTLLVIWNRDRPVAPIVLLASEATLLIYLFHRVFQRLTEPITDPWPDLLRILGQAAIGVGGPLALAVAARRLLGHDRARRYLGA